MSDERTIKVIPYARVGLALTYAVNVIQELGNVTDWSLASHHELEARRKNVGLHLRLAEIQAERLLAEIKQKREMSGYRD